MTLSVVTSDCISVCENFVNIAGHLVFLSVHLGELVAVLPDIFKICGTWLASFASNEPDVADILYFFFTSAEVNSNFFLNLYLPVLPDTFSGIKTHVVQLSGPIFLPCFRASSRLSA